MSVSPAIELGADRAIDAIVATSMPCEKPGFDAKNGQKGGGDV
jgi:hypothetical protein